MRKGCRGHLQQVRPLLKKKKCSFFSPNVLFCLCARMSAEGYRRRWTLALLDLLAQKWKLLALNYHLAYTWPSSSRLMCERDLTPQGRTLISQLSWSLQVQKMVLEVTPEACPSLTAQVDKAVKMSAQKTMKYNKTLQVLNCDIDLEC